MSRARSDSLTRSVAISRRWESSSSSYSSSSAAAVSMRLLMGLLSSWATPAVRVPMAWSLCDCTRISWRRTSSWSMWLIPAASWENSSWYLRLGVMGVRSPPAMRRVAIMMRSRGARI